jgi:hypothetical protein
MQLIILTTFYIFLSCVSLKTNPKFCVNCKFAINSKYDNKFIKCILFPINEELNDSYFLVTGVNSNSISEQDYVYCSTARKFDNMCGKEGKMYKLF